MFEHKHMDGCFAVGTKYRNIMIFLKNHGYQYIFSDDADTIVELNTNSMEYEI